MRKNILCGQDKCQYYHNGRGCLNCIHNPDTHVYKLSKQIRQLQAENEIYRKALEEVNRDCLCCPALGDNCKGDSGNISACYRQKMIAKQALKGGEK